MFIVFCAAEKHYHFLVTCHHEKKYPYFIYYYILVRSVIANILPSFSYKGLAHETDHCKMVLNHLFNCRKASCTLNSIMYAGILYFI